MTNYFTPAVLYFQLTPVTLYFHFTDAFFLYFQPELDVVVSVNEPLLNENQLKEANLISITMESLYSPPDTWGLSGPQFNYTSALPLPISGSVSLYK